MQGDFAFRADSPDLPTCFRDETYRFYSPAQIERMLAASGFDGLRTLTLRGGASIVTVVAKRAVLATPTPSYVEPNGRS